MNTPHKTATAGFKKSKQKPFNSFKERLKAAATKKTGYWWNGLPVHIRVLNVIVTEHKIPGMYWAEPFIGKPRQVIEVIKADNSVEYIDNKDGSGMIKVVHGKGAGTVFHRGIINPEIIGECQPYEINNNFNIEAYREIERVISAHCEQHYPEMWEKMKAARVKKDASINRTQHLQD